MTLKDGGNFIKRNVLRGVISTILGLVLFAIGCLLWFEENINYWAAGGLNLAGLVLILSPDTWIDVIKMIPDIIKAKFINSNNNDRE